MRTPTKNNYLIMSIGFGCALLIAACGGPRVLVMTGTLVGLEGTPGNPNDGQTPAVTFGYRRAEAALVPVKKTNCKKADQQCPDTPPQATNDQDAASILATFNLAHNWFGPAKIEQYIVTGLAAHGIAKSDHYALVFRGYEQSVDSLADRLANAYRDSNRDQAANKCWNAVKLWMNDKFPNLPPLDIVTRAFINQRKILFEDNTVKEACPEPAADRP